MLRFLLSYAIVMVLVTFFSVELDQRSIIAAAFGLWLFVLRRKRTGAARRSGLTGLVLDNADDSRPFANTTRGRIMSGMDTTMSVDTYEHSLYH